MYRGYIWSVWWRGLVTCTARLRTETPTVRIFVALEGQRTVDAKSYKTEKAGNKEAKQEIALSELSGAQ